MATILLSAAGASLGGAAGGTLAGLSTVAVGRAVGATLGRVIDERLLGNGSDAVETGRVDRFRLTQSGEGMPIAQVFGRMRVGGQVIWATEFQESVATSGGGKGAPRQPKITQYSYTVSLAIAVCEGEVASVGRVWADGEEISPDDLNMRVYTGAMDQMPDPLIEAVEGEGQVPAYRGTAYVVLENLPLEQFGNRIPQFSFEVVRHEQPDAPSFADSVPELVRGVAMVPGTGEYSLATTPVYYSDGPGSSWPANVNSPSGRTDFEASFGSLLDELPQCRSASLVVSWFGGDLRCGECELRPKVERRHVEGQNMPWSVSGVHRQAAIEIEMQDGRPIYGGTPSDRSVVEAIRHMREAGQEVMFYPFILMDQQQGNGLPDPWTGAKEQPALPWRGRITLSVAPGRDGTQDRTVAADAQVKSFFGTARAADFAIGDGVVTYTGPDEWSLRRFILHYAALCACAGGVESFCIGSEMRSLTQIRGANGFAAVEELRSLAAEARSLLGAETRIGYAADWSEYFGYQPQDGSGDRYFHLDPLWADDNIDFVGIDNYMPLSDWREGEDHLDATTECTGVHDLGYLRSNIEGGEGYDWYYHSPEAEAAQIRTPITDDVHGEPWVWRYKDVRNWWAKPHHERIGGVRQQGPTAWDPMSKPIRFTELGCAAIDKGTNQPNKFLDPKSSESQLPRFSNGQRDDLIQLQYLSAVLGYWRKPGINPVSEVYGGQMIDLDHMYVWAWDTRPFPFFPNNRDQWMDGRNYGRGHWLNGRSGTRSLASVVEEICRRSGVPQVDVSGLRGVVRGYVIDQVSDARTALQPLMLRHGFDVVERGGILRCVMRTGLGAFQLPKGALVDASENGARLERSREAETEMAGRVRLRFVQAEADFDIVAEEAVLPDDETHSVSSSEVAMVLTRGEGRQVVERWLTEARVSRETMRFALPPSLMEIGSGDVVRLPKDQGGGVFRVDRVEQTDMQVVEAVRIEPEVYRPSEISEDLPSATRFSAPVPVLPLFLDLPLVSGEEVPHAPHLAVAAKPWPGTVAVYASDTDENYALDRLLAARSTIGVSETPLGAASAGLWDEADALQVRLICGTLESRPAGSVLNGANLAAIGDGSSGNWEVFQFRNAELIGSDTYLISGRLRGQLGSDALMPEIWPAGSWFVLLDGSPAQVALSSSQRRVTRNFRIGPARRGYDDPSYVHKVEAFDGNGLRPYSPVHLSGTQISGGDWLYSWIRRTRIDGDSWDTPEVPVAEEQEAYLVRVMAGSAVLREATVEKPQWTHAGPDVAADLSAGADRIEIAQISARFGPGLPASLNLSA
ncbi:baseplate multidomain protein megatron [Primorskyibacter sp. S87]|uniref:baseplate multidomain protein megatron n=1 Tax=Primorskyibacter sp. S87 TaxID=3415126 RepID=UPI003C7C8923